MASSSTVAVPNKAFARFSTAKSRALLEEFRRSAAQSAQQRSVFTMSTAASSKKKASEVCAIIIEHYEEAMQRKAYDEAVGFLLEAIRLGEGHHDVLFNVAALLQHRGSHREALEYFTRAIANDPMHAEDYLRRSECHAALNAPALAFAELRKHFQLQEPSKSQLVKCGKFALDADMLDESEYYLQQALATPAVGAEETAAAAANDAYACFNLGELFERRGMDVEALRYFAQVTERDPSFPQPYLTQANTEFTSGNYPMALHLYEAIAKITPDDPSIYVRLADVYERLGVEFRSSVLDSLTRAVDLTPPADAAYVATLVRRGILLYKTFEDYDNSIRDFTLALEQSPDCSDGLLHRASCFLRRQAPGDYLDAIEDYRKAVDLPISWADKAGPLAVLAKHEFEEGNASRAAEYYALAALWMTLSEEEALRAAASSAKVVVQRYSPAALISSDEGYEPRQYVVTKDEKARKAMEVALHNRGPPVLPVAYTAVDLVYVRLRELEPTLHSQLELDLIDTWRPFREEVERLRDEDNLKGKKGRKK